MFSAAVHGALLGAVALGPPPSQRPKRPIYESIIRPNEKKIIWYRKVPDILPTVKVGDQKEPRGTVQSTTTTIAITPKPKSSQQLILQPAPEIKLERDVPVPNLIGLSAPLLIAPPTKLVKKFVPPAPPKTAAPAPVLLEPDVTVTWTNDGGAVRSLTMMRPKRAFVAPPRPDASKSAKPVVLESAPELGSEGAAQLAKLPGLGIPKAPSRRFTPPSGKASSGGGGGNGVSLDIPPQLSATSNLSAAIVGLRPSDRIDGPIPPGSRPGEFSAAPSVGKTATGDLNGAGGAALPGLMIKDGKSERAPSRPTVNPVPSGSKISIYDDLVPGSVRPMLSAPLRPSSRTIPMALEARFRGRLVYTIVIPVPKLAAYTADWIVWFAEPTLRPGETPRMRAPFPFQKIEPAETLWPPNGDRSEVRIQLTAIIKSNGKFESVSVLKGPPGLVSQNAIEDLKRWEFRPALRDGSPIDVEVVIEIPFSLAWLNASPYSK